MNQAPPQGVPFILIGRVGQKRMVVAADTNAQAQGIWLGMTATQANALVTGLVCEDANPAADAHALENLAQWALRHYSPIVAIDTDGLLIDATGATHLFGGEASMLNEIHQRITTAGYQARLAMAPTYGAAHALARFAKSCITIVEFDYHSHMFALPIAALRLEGETAQKLLTLGFETIGELGQVDRAALRLRFGAEISRRLDQMFAKAPELAEPVVPLESIIVKRNFAEPVAAHETLVRYIGKLVDTLCAILESKMLGGRTLDMHFHRVDNQLQAVRIGLAQPTRDAKRIARLFTDKLEQVDPGFGIELMTLSATWSETMSFKQTSLDANQQAQTNIASLIDILNNRLGPGHVYQLIPVESDVPERSVKRVEPLSCIEKKRSQMWPRPVRLFPKPELIETIAMLPDYPPVAFTWRGERHKVMRADGPERLFGEWWKRPNEMEAVRDYFQLEDEYGERFWVFRAGDGVLPDSGSQKWFIHGIFGCVAYALITFLNVSMELTSKFTG